MARYKGPKSKIARRFREPIFGPDKVLERKNYGPGQHGPNKRRGKQSEYTIQLQEKQKAKYTYGILERQFSNMFKKASQAKGITGENLLQLCESRLDNLVFRFGVAPTRSAARQLISPGHITVEGEVVNVPSFHVKVGKKVAVRTRSASLESISNSLSSHSNKLEWLDWDSSKLSGRIINMPHRDQIPENIREQLIVELYSK